VAGDDHRLGRCGLAVVVLVGLLVLNPDIMADIKMAIPFYPIATILFAAALSCGCFTRPRRRIAELLQGPLPYGGSKSDQPPGFTFVAEAASEEYLANHPSHSGTFSRIICVPTPTLRAWNSRN